MPVINIWNLKHLQYLLKIGSEHVHCIDQVTDHWDISYLWQNKKKRYAKIFDTTQYLLNKRYGIAFIHFVRYYFPLYFPF